jgi:hypothetical protein
VFETEAMDWLMSSGFRHLLDLAECIYPVASSKLTVGGVAFVKSAIDYATAYEIRPAQTLVTTPKV